MIGIHQPTETEMRSHARHRAFHRDIEARAAALREPAPLPPARCQMAFEGLPDPSTLQEIPGSVWFTITNGSPRKKLSMLQIKQAVCDHFDVTMNDLISPRRQLEIVFPRHVAAYLCKELTQSTFPAIGRAFGGRDHTTVLSSYRKIARLLPTDDRLAVTVAEIRTGLEALL